MLLAPERVEISYTEKSLEDRSMKTLAKLVKEEEEGIHT